jgi:dolichyl-phosphate-mannose--protein O-mannosyl transferase
MRHITAVCVACARIARCRRRRRRRHVVVTSQDVVVPWVVCSNTMYPAGCQYYILREITAFFGSLQPLVMFALARQLGTSLPGATFAATLVIVDVFNVMESRCVLTDSQLIFYVVLGLLVSLKWFERLNREVADKTPMSGGERAAWIVGVGMALGASISVKWTGLATPGMVGLEILFRPWFLRRRPRVVDVLIIAAIAAAQYHLWFYIHFQILTRPGEHDPTRKITNFFVRMWTLNRDMLVGSASISVPHRWESKYHQWVRAVNATAVVALRWIVVR